MAVEKEIEKTESALLPNAVFDESSNFLIYATLLGIKVRFFSYSRVTITSVLSVIQPLHIYNFSLFNNAMIASRWNSIPLCILHLLYGYRLLICTPIKLLEYLERWRIMIGS